MELRIVIVAVALAVAGLVLAALSATALGAAKAADKWPSAERPAMGEKPAAAGVGLGAILCGAAAGFAASAIPLDSTAGLTAIVVVAAAAALAAVAWAAVLLAGRIELSALINTPSPVSGEPQTAMSAAATQQGVAGYGQPYPGVVSPPSYGAPGSPSALSAGAIGEATAANPDGFHTTAPASTYPTTQSGASAAEAVNNPHIPGGGADPSIPPDALPGWVYTDDADSWYLVVGMPGGGRLLRLTDFAVMPPGSAAGALTLAGSIEMTVWPAGSEDAASEPQNR